MNKNTRKVAALMVALTIALPVCSFADDGAAPEPANAQAAQASGGAAEGQAQTPGPAVVSTGTANTIIKPEDVRRRPAFEMLDRIETIVYGNRRDGGLLNRLNDVEKSIFGRELPGSLTERQTALIDFLERGLDTQPSVLFKLSVAEWGVGQEIHPTWGLTRRIDAMEAILEGTNQSGPLVSRLERLLTKLLPEGILATQFELPKETIVKGVLLDTLTIRNVKVGDIVILGLNEQILVENTLVAPKGSRVFAHITKVKPPRSFGRSSQIEMEVDGVEVLGPTVVPVNIGDAAKKAMEADSAVIGAAGASLAGAVLLGPVGLAGGFLIRGNDKQLKEGTLFYAQISESAQISAYQVPSQISPLTQPSGPAPQGTRSDPNLH